VNKSSLKLASAALAATFFFQSASFAGLPASNRVAKRTADIKALEVKNQDDNLRIANVAKVQAEVARVEAMAVNSPTDGDAKCKAIAAALTMMSQIKKPSPNPLDSQGKGLKYRLVKARSATVAASKGLTCVQLDFFTPDEAPVAP
jgi:hypothetical protein